MKLIEAELFDKIYPQITSSHEEIAILSKKNPDGAINKFKLKFINELLEYANEILHDSTPFASFEKFIEEDMPTNSDVIYMLAQYVEALDKLKCENIKEEFGSWYWIVSDGQGELETTAPAIKYR